MGPACSLLCMRRVFKFYFEADDVLAAEDVLSAEVLSDVTAATFFSIVA